MGLKADIDFTKDLFDAANKMRGSIAPSEYKHIVLPLIFLRFLSLRYDNHCQEEHMVNSHFDDLHSIDDLDQKISEEVYVLPEESRWSFIMSNAKKPEIKEILDNAMRLIEDRNPDLRDVLPKIYKKTNLPTENIAGLIEVFSRDIFSHDHNNSVDVLGRVYEYFIGNFASSEGNRGGEFFTPSSIVKLLVAMLEPKSGSVFDPACGSAGMFIQSKEYALNKNSLSFYGQENVETTIRLGKMNALMHGIKADIRLGNSLLDDQFKSMKFDYVIANPPFNLKEWGANRISQSDPRLLGKENDKLITNSNANYFWMQHFLYHLKEGGTAGFVMANGAMTTSGAGEKEVRIKLVDEGFIDCVVQLPDKLFLTTGIPCCLFFLSKNRKGENGYRVRNNEILFIDARKKGSLVSKKQRVLSDEDIKDIVTTYHAYKKMDQEYKDITGFSIVTNLDVVRENDYKLTPGLYVGTEVSEIDETVLDQRMDILLNTLEQQFGQATALQEKILRNLGDLL